MAKYRVAVIGTVGKSVLIDDSLSSRVAKLETQIATAGGVTAHNALTGLQVGDDHPQYTMWAAPETIKALWNFQTIPYIQGETLAEYIEDVVAGGSDPFIADSPSIAWTYDDTGNHLQADVVDEYIEDLVGSMLVDTSTVDFTYDDVAGTISATVPGAALTKVDDTNVTLALGGSPTTALARAASITVGWTGQLAVSRGGSGAATLTGYLKGNGTSAFTAVSSIPGSDITGAALTKTDDTNVTLTLGGSPTTALLNAASLTLGWTGTLANSRGGTGTGTYTTGDLLYASAANTLSKRAIGSTNDVLAVVGGVPTWSQSISPTWTGVHTFTRDIRQVNTLPNFVQRDTDAATDEKTWYYFNSGGTFSFYAVSDDEGSFRAAMRFSRIGFAVTDLTFGNATDSPTFSFDGGNMKLLRDNQEFQLGASQDLRFYHDGTNSVIRNDTGDLKLQTGTTEIISFNAAPTTGAQTATFSATNKPGTGTAGPTKWWPVKLGGTTYYIPLFGA